MALFGGKEIAARRLSEVAARAWLFGQVEALAEVEDIRRGGVLCVELT